ncbi:tyrosine-type recombinase/integrase [Ampullimonas aquatilis]|uniref:tyrosine-type recombinase/integrase n=1 Tax=Ampullimonas aquatilis TaxID=1341549 RepID=UPI003C70B0DD
MALTDAALRNAKPTDKAYALRDGGSLYLWVTVTGSKLWRWSYRYEGKEKLMSFGAYPLVSLVDARTLRDEARKQLNAGTDPMAERKNEKQAKKTAADNSFATIAKLWFEGWHIAKSPRHADYVWRRLETDIFPAIGYRPIADILSPELVIMVKAIADRGALDIAKRAHQTVGQIYRYAIAHGYASRNPATDIKPSDILASRKKTNYARIDSKDLPDLLRKIEGYSGAAITRLAIKLMALTFVRTTELIAAEWSEFDLDAARWDIPAERMKMKTPHIVPLSDQAVEILRTLHLITGHGCLLFPGERSFAKPMSNNTILKALERMGYKGRMTGHGFRGVASTLLHEQGFDHAHIELQLAHQERNAVSAAYNHATYLQPRAQMMQHWANYLDGVKGGAKVVSFRAA